MGSGESGRILYRHESPVSSLAVSPNQELIVSADTARNLKFFFFGDRGHRQTHRHASTSSSHIVQSGMAFHPSETSYALSDFDPTENPIVPTLEIWDYGARQPTRILTGHQKPVSNLAFHPQGKQLVAGLSDGTICVWNPDTGEYLHSWKDHISRVESLAYSPDGTKLASISSDSQLRIWNNTGKVLQAIAFDPFIAGSRVSWNDAGSRVVIGFGSSESKVIDVTSGKTVLVLPGGLGIYTPDGKQILYVEGPDGKQTNGTTIIACDALTGKETKRFEGHTNRVADLIVNADGQRLISIDAKELTVWNMNTRTQIMKLQPTQSAGSKFWGNRVFASPNSSTLACQGRETTILWSTSKITEPSQELEKEGP